ncbi:hypothetical protein B0H10DRAFT_2112658 [Mycena sp. CBHHK59/15]|nr:hypothetical protein B0H10DRAFT_2112658 [Mycena sp. CBHHK59/15]
MHTFAILIAIVAASPAIAFPSNMTARQDQTCVHCGTTSDATLSDCQALVQPDTWNSAWAAGSNVCHWSSATPGWYNNKAYNVACHGNCCAYYSPYPNTDPTFDQEITRQRAQSLLGCGDAKVNKINGLEITRADKSGVCLSNGNGCGDCFDDSDFASTCQ